MALQTLGEGHIQKNMDPCDWLAGGSSIDAIARLTPLDATADDDVRYHGSKKKVISLWSCVGFLVNLPSCSLRY